MAFDQIKILIIYTGGTIGMVRDKDTGSLHPVNGQELHEHIPILDKLDYQIEFYRLIRCLILRI